VWRWQCSKGPAFPIGFCGDRFSTARLVGALLLKPDKSSQRLDDLMFSEKLEEKVLKDRENG
jgi:hypothetical protein